MNFSKLSIATLILGASSLALAHKPGFYKIDGNDQAVVSFAVTKECAASEGALKGKLRVFTFTEAAETGKYNFKSGFYVETHEGKDEFYVKTDTNCKPAASNVKLAAKKTELGGYSIEPLK